MTNKGNGKDSFHFQSIFEALEDRVLFDGVPDATFFVLPQDEVQQVPAQIQNVHQADVDGPRELVFIDAGVEQSEELLAEILANNSEANLEIRFLDAGTDGVGQISDVLSNADGKYDAIHIISHGDEGEVHLGNATLSSENLGQYANQLAGWSSALTTDSDLLFYGCELAGSAEGEQFIQTISAMTGADVAASDDLTGDEELGGDWELEFEVGELQTASLSAEEWNSVLLDGSPVPTVSLNIPPEEFINEDFEFSVTFSNTGADPSDVGYAPYVDLSVPDGIDINGATFLGAAITAINAGVFDAGGNLVDGAGDPINHPITDLPVTGTPGETLWVVNLPFGSFVPGQPAADIMIDATLNSSSGATVGTPMDIDASGGFALGCDPQDNAAADPPITGGTDTAGVTPIVVDLVKQFDAEDGIETVSGPNNPVLYTLVVDIADGETISNLEIEDLLPNSYVYVGGSINVDASESTGFAGLSLSDLPTAGSPQNDNSFLIEFSSITGSSSDRDVVIEYEIWVAEFDANGNPVISPTTGDETFTTNDSSVSGTYGGAAVGDDGPDTDLRLEQESLSVQKDVQVVTDVGGVGATPGDTLEYTIDVQVSDFFEFSNLVLSDNFSDGQTFDATFNPTYTISEAGSVTSGTFDPSNFSVSAGTLGSTDVVYNLSSEIADGTLTGNAASGATFATVTFRTVINDAFSTNFPSGDPSVDLGDILTNTVAVSGQLPSGQTETDTGGTSITIEGISVTKEVYAIEGVLFNPGDEITAGRTTTYRLTMQLPTSDVENLVLTDYLPLPFYNATEVTTFNTAIAGTTPPPVGVATFGPSHTLDTVVPGTAGGPTISTSSIANTLVFDFGSFDAAPSQPSTIDILFTVTGQDVLVADSLILNNQLFAQYDSTNSGTISAAALAPVVVAAPELELTKGIVATNAVSPVYSPGTTGPVSFNPPGSATSFAGGINSTNLSTNPIDSNLSGADAGDLVTFAIVIENTGGADGFDLLIQDTLPAEFVIPGGGSNLQVRDGDGNVLAYTGAPGDLFTTGIELTDPSASAGVIASLDDADAAGDGSNIIVITYDLELTSAVEPNQSYLNDAELAEYGALDGGNDHTLGSSNANWTDSATVDILNFESTKSIVATSESHTGFVSGDERVTIGEIVRYRLSVEIPEGTMTDLQIRDLLPEGLMFLDDGTATVAFVSSTGTGITSNDIAGSLSLGLGTGPAETGTAPVTPTFALPDGNIGSSSGTSLDPDSYTDGTDPYFKFGEVVNSDRDADSEFIVVEFNALVVNEAAASNDQNDARDNQFQVRLNSTVEDTSNTIRVRVTEPLINNVNKTVDPTSGDAGDTVTYTITFSNSSGATQSDAFDVRLLDTVPADMTLSLGTINVVTGGGVSGVTNNSSGNTLDITFDEIPTGGTVTVTFEATLDVDVQPDELLVNAATVTYTSLPGSGTAVNPTGSSVSGASGTDTGERDGSGVHNDYTDSDTAELRINSPTITKTLLGTGIVSATNENDEAVIGETVQYQFTVTLPEGTINASEIVDTLDLGLGFVSLDSISTSAGVVSSTVDLNDETTISPSVVGQTVTFDLGNIVNSNSSDSTPETIVITYTAVVENVASNQGDGNPGVLLDNSATFEWEENGNAESTSSATAASVEVLEANLDIDKQVSAALFDAGDSLTYTIVIDHNTLSDTDAFDLTFSDVIPSFVSVTSFDATHSVSGSIASLFELTAGNELRTLTGSTFDLLSGESVTITIDGVVGGSVAPNQAITNVATVDWTSIDGVNQKNEAVTMEKEERSTTMRNHLLLRSV